MKRTVKSRIGDVIIPIMPINRRSFDILRYEFNAAVLRLKNALSLSHRLTVSALANKTNLSINLGSGGTGLAGWVNVEFRRMTNTTLQLDLRRPLPFAASSAQRVMLEHVLEHLDFCSDAPALLREVHRILQPGGTLRVVVPDCRRYCQAYVSGDNKVWKTLGWDLDRLPDNIHTPMHIMNHTFHQGGEHLFGYDFETLALLLNKSGFLHVEKMTFGVSVDPLLAIDQPNHFPYSLYVDAVKTKDI